MSGATEEQIEAALDAWFAHEDQGIIDWVGTGSRYPTAEEQRRDLRSILTAVVAASSSMSAHPAGEQREAEGLQAEAPKPGQFFEVTGAESEIFKIVEGINANEGRLSAGDSASLDLWQEMLGEWISRVKALGVAEAEGRRTPYASRSTPWWAEPASSAATAPGDRGKLARPRSEGGVWGSYVAYLAELEAALAARVEVDEAKLAKLIGDASLGYNLSDRSAESYACGAPDYRSRFIARAVAEWLRGEG